MRTATRISRLALVAAAALAIAFAGCGGDDDDKSNNESAQAALEKKIEAVEKRSKREPTSPAAHAELAKLRFQLAGLKTNETGQFDDDSKDELRRATKSWDRYIALDPKPLDTTVAQLMAAAYGPGSLDNPKKAVDIQRVVTRYTKPPSAEMYAQLAQMAYYAGEKDVAERAAKHAIQLTPESRRTQMREALAASRSQLQPE